LRCSPNSLARPHRRHSWATGVYRVIYTIEDGAPVLERVW
jgi:hypothetical protein